MGCLFSSPKGPAYTVQHVYPCTGRFRRDSSLQSPKAIVTALENGSLALKYLTTPSELPEETIERLSTNISAAPPPCCPRPMPQKQRVWPHPDATPVLEVRPRPREALPHGKKRHIPIFVNATGVPFLRFKKPQSPYLSRVIRNKQKQRAKRFELSLKLQEELGLAEDEDMWDYILAQEISPSEPTEKLVRNSSLDPTNPKFVRPTVQEEVAHSDRLEALEGLWADTLNEEIETSKKKFLEDKKRTAAVAERMWNIVQKERALKAAEEGKEAVKQDDLMKGRGLWAMVRNHRKG